VSFQKTVQKVGRLTKTHVNHNNYITWSLYKLQLQVVVPNVVPMNGNLELPPSAKAPFLATLQLYLHRCWVADIGSYPSQVGAPKS
jgi:hypothetical protein